MLFWSVILILGVLCGRALLTSFLVPSTMPAPSSTRRGHNSRNHAQRSSKLSTKKNFKRNFKFKLRERYGALQCQNGLKSAFLNIDGLSDAKLEDVVSFTSVHSPDVFFLLETKRRLEDIGSDISVPGYDLAEVRRSDCARDKAGGGIACYTKDSGGILFKRYSPNIEHADLEYVNNERVWVTVDSLHSKTAICGLYMGTQYNDDRNREWNDGMYWVLRQETFALRSSGYRILFLGDFNGHVGNLMGQGIVGNNGDINKNGERFLSFLDTCNLRHINGEHRREGETDRKICSGLWTRQRGNSRSVIDYVAISAEHMDSVVSMFVDDTGSFGGGSDHNWSGVELRDKFRNLVRVNNYQKKKSSVWNIQDDQDWTLFKQKVVEHLPQDDISHLGVNELASLLTSAFRNGGLASIGYKKSQPKIPKKSRSLPGYLVAELDLKRNMEKNWKSMSSSVDIPPDTLAAAEEAFLEQKKKVDDIFINLKMKDRSKIRAACSGKTRGARRNFWAAVSGKVKQSSDISSVLSNDGELKCGVDDICREVEDHLCTVFQGSTESFSQQLPQSSSHVDHPYCSSSRSGKVLTDHTYCKNRSPKLPRIGVSDDLAKHPSNWLSRDFSLKEIKKIAAMLNSGKAQGWDKMPQEFIKFAPEPALKILTLLFNKIKNSGTFPVGWNCGRITLVHKKGLRAKLGNYRPITVLVAMSGFYSRVLNERLIEVVESHSLLGEIQNGFRKDRCGADNIFILNTILWKARAMGEKVHLGFVDIQKAYDSINRELLWKRLELLGIDGLFLETLKSMYSDDSVRCTVNGATTRSVFLRRGLRQGCSLSPMLFALYVIGIGEDLSKSGEGFSVGNVMVSGLLFADDIVLISRTSEGLKRLFRVVKDNCDKLLLEVNTGDGKSEVVSPTDDLWEILDSEGSVDLSLKQVIEYTYLGLETQSSIWRTCVAKQRKCIKTANKYKFSCLYLGKRGPDVVDVSLATWNNIAIPSILFGCESILFKETAILELEKIQSQVAKGILGVPSNTANICAQTELGIVPFRLALYKCQLKFYFRALDLPSYRWVKQAMLEHLSLVWPSPYFKYITDLRNTVCLPFLPPTQRYLGVHLHQWSLSETNYLLSKLSLPNVKTLTTFSRQPYAFDHPHMDTLAQFRLSNAGLGNRYPRVGGVRYARMSSCPLCPSDDLSEAHVIFFCPAVELFREELDLTVFRAICRSKGFGDSHTFRLYVNGFDWNENPVSGTDFASRGLALDTLRGHWLSRW